MDDYEPFSKRQERARRAGYQYDNLPPEFRQQVIYIWGAAVGFCQRPTRSYWQVEDGDPPQRMNWFWDKVEEYLTEEYGVKSLGNGGGNSYVRCEEELLNGTTDGALNIVELSFRYMGPVLGRMTPGDRKVRGIKLTLDEAIAKLNKRFLEHAIGYQFESGQLIRIDDQLVFQEVTQPALHLMHAEGFEGPLKEFLDAYNHYRKGPDEFDDAIVGAAKAFESTLKAILAKRGNKRGESLSGKKLVELFCQSGIVPGYLQSFLLGLLTVRNEDGAHGGGLVSKDEPIHLVAYVLHLAAANILLAIEAHKAQPLPQSQGD
ncbi:MAG: hypothetical protein HY914_15660 [Desulfomonile tiedjei]|nr:hypothetical protein [Desulfomonile tiedjei]